MFLRFGKFFSKPFTIPLIFLIVESMDGTGTPSVWLRMLCTYSDERGTYDEVLLVE